MNEIRQRQLSDAIRDKIALMIVGDAIKDPRVGRAINITHIKLASDNSFAKVFISSYKGSKALREAAEGLNSAAGFIRGQLGKSLKTRNTPKLFFVVDEGLKEGFILGELIKQAVAEIKEDDSSITD
jgi:ribosome-binding factor A